MSIHILKMRRMIVNVFSYTLSSASNWMKGIERCGLCPLMQFDMQNVYIDHNTSYSKIFFLSK